MSKRADRSQIASGIADADYGRIGLAFVAVLVLVPLITALVVYYVGEYGVLPFTFKPGPLGITPWEPAVVLLVALILLVATPLVLHRIAPAGDTFYSQAAVNRRDSLLLSAAIVVLLALTAYVIAAVVSLRTSVGAGVCRRGRGDWRGIGLAGVHARRAGAAAHLVCPSTGGGRRRTAARCRG